MSILPTADTGPLLLSSHYQRNLMKTLQDEFYYAMFDMLLVSKPVMTYYVFQRYLKEFSEIVTIRKIKDMKKKLHKHK